MLDALPGVPGGTSGTSTSSMPPTSRSAARSINPDATARARSHRRWLVWGTYADDYFPTVFGRTRDWRARRCSTPGCRCSCRSTARRSRRRLNPMERGLADLWARTAGPMSAGARAAVPQGDRGHDRELAVGAGQPDPEPHPRPGRLRRDAPQDLRLGPDDEPVPGWRTATASRPSLPAPGRCGTWTTRRPTTPA